MLYSLLALICLGQTQPPAPWETVVRIHAGNTIRSGVVIQSDERSSVVITCGHDWKGLNREVEVDLFDGVLKSKNPAQVSFRKRCPGELILLEEKLDYAYVRIWPDEVLPASPIALSWNPQIDEELITSGSSEGQDPTVWTTHVEAIERNAVACTHGPKQGRSGGGLFNLQFELVGICVGRYENPDPSIPQMGRYIRLKPPPSRRR